jgi:hypothetical protein
VQLSGFNLGASASQVEVEGTSQPVVSWSDQAIVFTVSDDNDGGAILVRRADGVTATIGAFSVVPHLDRTESNNVHAGDQLVVDGASLGPNTGTVTIGSDSATTLLWSRDSVLVQVPTSMTPGTYPVSVTTAGGAVSNALSLTLVPGPSAKPTSAAATGAPTGVGGALAPSFNNNHQFVKPIKPPSPVYFNVTVDPHSVRAGGTATVTVTLKLNDKPVSGADIRLAMLFTPGSDYKFTPESGTTDADGVFKATVRVSKNAGDSVVAATSGVFSDQDHVTGTSNGATPGGSSPVLSRPAAANGGFAPLLVLGVVAVGLVATGVYLNMRSMRG